MLKLDHCVIYVFIAGSHTPFALGAIGITWSWILFGLVWALAGYGVALKVFDRLSDPWLFTGLYLAMGWFVLIAAVPLADNVPMPGVHGS